MEKHQRRWGLKSLADHEVRPEWDSPMSVYLKSQSSSLLVPLASLRLIPLARLSHRYPGKDCYRTMKPHLMCFAWLCSNDTIQREMGIIQLLPPH